MFHKKISKSNFDLFWFKLTGILRDKTMGDKFMYIPNDAEQNYYMNIFPL